MLNKSAHKVIVRSSDVIEEGSKIRMSGNMFVVVDGTAKQAPTSPQTPATIHAADIATPTVPQEAPPAAPVASVTRVLTLEEREAIKPLVQKLFSIFNFWVIYRRVADMSGSRAFPLFRNKMAFFLQDQHRSDMFFNLIRISQELLTEIIKMVPLELPVHQELKNARTQAQAIFMLKPKTYQKLGDFPGDSYQTTSDEDTYDEANYPVLIGVESDNMLYLLSKLHSLYSSIFKINSELNVDSSVGG